jgi:NADH dehydrogenase I D subunit
MFKGFQTKSDPRKGPDTMVLNLGPQHPATHGTLRNVVQLDGERIVACVPHIGYLHCGFEKQAESMDLMQYVTVTDRMNYVSSISNNVAFTSAVEKLFDLEITERCAYLRTIMIELSRIADHLVCIGTHVMDLGAFTVFLWFWQDREEIYDLFEWATGQRLTCSYTRIGGLSRDLPDGWVEKCRPLLDRIEVTIGKIEGLLNKNRIFIDRTKGIGCMSPEDAINWGVTGPVLRACGAPHDLRRDEPYLVYDRFDFDIPVGTTGDVYDRYLVRIEEMRQSVRILRQAFDQLPGGPVNVGPEYKVCFPPKEEVWTSMEALIHHFEIVMPDKGPVPPPGEVYAAQESPNGELGFYIVSNGEKLPYRVRVRPPSYYQYQVMGEMVKGHLIADAIAVLGSLNVIAGELDR